MSRRCDRSELNGTCSSRRPRGPRKRNLPTHSEKSGRAAAAVAATGSVSGAGGVEGGGRVGSLTLHLLTTSLCLTKQAHGVEGGVAGAHDSERTCQNSHTTGTCKHRHPACHNSTLSAGSEGGTFLPLFPSLSLSAGARSAAGLRNV